MSVLLLVATSADVLTWEQLRATVQIRVQDGCADSVWVLQIDTAAALLPKDSGLGYAPDDSLRASATLLPGSCPSGSPPPSFAT